MSYATGGNHMPKLSPWTRDDWGKIVIKRNVVSVYDGYTAYKKRRATR